MNKIKLLAVLCAGLPAGGCMATVTPDGTISTAYIVPSPTIVVERPTHVHYVPFLPPVVHRHPPRSYAPRLVPITPRPHHIAKGPPVRVPYAPPPRGGGPSSARAPQHHGRR